MHFILQPKNIPQKGKIWVGANFAFLRKTFSFF